MPEQMLRIRGVYVLNGRPYAALPNNEEDGAYAFALADVELRGTGYALKESQSFGLFVDVDGKLFSVYARDRRAAHKTFRSLRDTGQTIPARNLKAEAV